MLSININRAIGSLFLLLLFFVLTGITEASSFKEKEINEIIIKSVTGEKNGQPKYLNQKEIVKINFQDIAALVAKKNIEVGISSLNTKIFKKNTIAADAAFDSLLSCWLTFSHVDQHERTDDFYRRHEVTLEDEEYAWIGKVTIDDIEFQVAEQSASQFETSWVEEYASTDSFPDYFRGKWNGGLGANRAFEWGQYLNLSLEFQYYQNEYPSLGDYASFYYTDESYIFGKNPWTSSLSATFSTPMPFCKNFGPLGSVQSVNKKTADLTAVMYEYQEKSTTNSVLENAILVYWDIVDNIHKLYTTIEHTQYLEALAKDSADQLNSGEKTIYTHTQVQANWNNMLNAQEIAWLSYIINSNKLCEILGIDSDHNLILPVGYANELDKTLNIDRNEATSTALQKHPDLKAANKDIELQELNFQFKKRQKRPDLTLSFSCSLSQNSTYYGYPSLKDSLGHLFDPDTRYFYVGIKYVWPVGNSAAKSAFNQAKIRQKKSRINYNYQKNQIIQKITAQVSIVNSTLEQRKKAQMNLKLKDYTFKEAISLYREKDVTEFEFLRKYNELLDAKNANVDALVQYQKSYTQLRAAQGILLKN